MAKQFLSDLRVGERAETFAAMRKMDLRDYNGTKYILMELGDRSGRIKATLWNNPEAVARSINTGDVVKIVGTVVTYKETPQIRIEAIRSGGKEEYSREDIFPGPSKSIRELSEEMDEIIASVREGRLRVLLDGLIGIKGEHREAFAKAPGGKLWHHNYQGGLLDHTVSVARIAQFLAKNYNQVDADLLVTAALLHDIGKVVEYQYETDVVDFSDEGRLKGHVVIGYEIVHQAVSGAEGFPEDMQKRLCHCVLAHQGQKDFGSPVVPQTLEALLLYYADEIDSKAGAFGRILGETLRQGKKWSEFVPLMERYLYAGPARADSESNGRKNRNS